MSSSSERKKPLQFGPNGCQANVNGEKCGEKRTLGIIDDFKSLYEKKLKEIESYGSGDGNLKAKINLQEQWIKDLQEQNEMMVTAIEELEKEATDRVKMLEDKLDNSSKCICELEDTMKSKDKDLDTLKKEYETEISDLQARNATSFIENSCLKNQLTEIRNEIKNSTALSSINLSEVLNNLENVDFSADFSCIRNTANKEHLLIAVMEQEINALKEVAEIKDAQLEDQVKIITELVTQLYNIDKGLNILEKKFISLFDNTSGKTISKYIEDSVSYELLNNQQNKNNTGSSNFNNVEFDVIFNIKRV